MIYYGTVTRVHNNHLYVKIPALGGNAKFGPLNAVILLYRDAVNDVQETEYEKGDRVVVGQVGHIKEELVVLGRVG